MQLISNKIIMIIFIIIIIIVKYDINETISSYIPQFSGL